MNKKELISAIADQCQLTLAQAEAAFNAAFNTIQSTMVEQGSVTVPGFGSFATKVREERKGRNPATGQEITIPKAIVPVFKASNQLKELVNNAQEK